MKTERKSHRLSDYIPLSSLKNIKDPDPNYKRTKIKVYIKKFIFFKDKEITNDIKIVCVKEEYQSIFSKYYLSLNDKDKSYYMTMGGLYNKRGILNYIFNIKDNVMVCDFLYYLLNFPDQYERYKHINSNINDITMKYDLLNKDKQILFKIIVNHYNFRKRYFFPCGEMKESKIDFIKDLEYYLNKYKYHHNEMRIKILLFLESLVNIDKIE